MSAVSSKRLSRRKPLAACVAAVFALSAPAVYANTFFVSNCANSGAGSLAAAAAGAVSGDHVSINITDNSACTHNLHGVTEVKVLNSSLTFGTGVTIDGPGNTTFGISGNHNYRALASTGDLTVNNLAVMYGKYLNSSAGGFARGGCIYAFNNLTLSGVTTYYCYAHESNGSGGTAAGGAVAANVGGVTMTNTVITNSKATGYNAVGGAVYAWTGGVTMTSSIITAAGSSSGSKYGAQALSSGGSGTNIAEGGAIWSDGTTTLSGGSKVTHGKAYVQSTSGGVAAGGGIWSRDSVTLNGGSSVYGNTANTQSNKVALGGGIYSLSSVITGGSGDTATVQGNSAYSKSGTARGGGIYGTTGVTTKYSYITNNSATGGSYSRAGGVYAKGGFTSKYSYFWSDSAAGGGAIIVPTGNTYVRGTSIAFNRGSNGFSGIDAWSGCNNYGGGSPSATVSIYQSTIAYNHPSTSTAGSSNGIYICANATKLYNNTIAYNSGSNHPVIVNGSGTSPTLAIKSNLMSGNSYGSTPTLNDLFTSGVTVSGDHNLIRAPATGVPGDTIVGKCPLFYRGRWLIEGIQWQWVMRHEVPSPATNAGANPLNLGADQRGGSITATSPPRVSGPPGGPAAADIGSYEIDQSDEIYDEQFEGCKI